MVYEDWTDTDIWTESDPGSDMTVAANLISIAGMRRDVQAYMQGDYEANHFGNFTIDIDTNFDISASANKATFEPLGMSDNAVSRTIKELYDNNDGWCFYWYKHSGAQTVKLLLHEMFGDNEDFHDYSAEETFYIKIVRDGDVITGYLYNDAERTDLNDTIFITEDSSTEYRYLNVSCSYETTGTEACDGWVANLDLHEVVPSRVPRPTAGVGNPLIF